MKSFAFLLAALAVVSVGEITNADSCPNFTGSALLPGGMYGKFEQKDCKQIKVSWGRADLSDETGQTFSLTTNKFRKDSSQGFGADIISYRYNVVGQSLVMQFKDDWSSEVDGYVFTMGQDGRLDARPL